MLFAGAHGLWFLPVVLSCAGGNNFGAAHDESSAENAKSKNDADALESGSRPEHADDSDPAVAKEEGETVERSTVSA